MVSSCRYSRGAGSDRTATRSLVRGIPAGRQVRGGVGPTCARMASIRRSTTRGHGGCDDAERLVENPPSANHPGTSCKPPLPRLHSRPAINHREVFPVYLHGRSRKGLPVLWEQIGKVNIARAEELGLPLTEILPNYVFLNECIWRVVLDKGENDNDDAQARGTMGRR